VSNRCPRRKKRKKRKLPPHGRKGRNKKRRDKYGHHGYGTEVGEEQEVVHLAARSDLLREATAVDLMYVAQLRQMVETGVKWARAMDRGGQRDAARRQFDLAESLYRVAFTDYQIDLSPRVWRMCRELARAGYRGRLISQCIETPSLFWTVTQ